MSCDYGPLLSFQITWRSGHIETVMAHQVLWPVDPSPFGEPQTGRPRVLFHGEVGGRWGLILAADEADILSVRRVSSDVLDGNPT
jgi:hypothetical protein